MSICFARTAAHERQLAIARSARIPFEKVFDLGRLPVLINTEEADIEIEARILEVVGIAAVKCHLLFRRKNEPHIIVAFVAIKMIHAALIQRHHIGTEPGFLFAFLLDLGNRARARGRCGVRRQAGFHGAIHARGHVFGRHQHIKLEISRFDFARLRFRVETVAHVVVFLAADFLQRVETDVMIRERESVCGNKRTAAPGVEAHTRFLQMLEPLRRRLEPIFFFQLLQWRTVKQPHALIPARREDDDKRAGESDEN